MKYVMFKRLQRHVVTQTTKGIVHIVHKVETHFDCFLQTDDFFPNKLSKYTAKVLRPKAFFFIEID